MRKHYAGDHRELVSREQAAIARRARSATLTWAKIAGWAGIVGAVVGIVGIIVAILLAK